MLKDFKGIWKAIVDEYGLRSLISPKTWNYISKAPVSEGNLDGPIVFPFGPISEPTQEYLQLPKECKVRFIGMEEELKEAACLLEMPIIGVDCEWRGSLHKFDKCDIGIMQVGNCENIFIFDMITLAKSHEFDVFMTQVFSTCKVLGAGFKSDLKMMQE